MTTDAAILRTVEALEERGVAERLPTPSPRGFEEEGLAIAVKEGSDAQSAADELARAAREDPNVQIFYERLVD